MSDLQNQVNLLNDYISTLQNQNISKSNQIRTLTDQNNNLIAECQALRKKGRASTVVINNSGNVQKLESQLKQVKTAYLLLLQNSSKKQDSNKLKQTIARLDSQKYILQQYKEKLEKGLKENGLQNIDNLVIKMKEYDTQIQENYSKIKIYQTRIVEYERKMTLLSNEINVKTSEIQMLQDQIKSSNSENTNTNMVIKNYQVQIQIYKQTLAKKQTQISVIRSEIQRLNDKQRDFVIIEKKIENIEREKQTLKRENQILSGRITSLSNNNAQISSYQTTINLLRKEQQQWESERQTFKLRLISLQSENLQKNNILNQLKIRQEYTNNSIQKQHSNLQRQTESLSNTIQSLRLEIEQHKKTISYRQSTIRNLQTKISSFDYSKSNQIANIQKIVEDKNNEMNRLIESHNKKISNLLIEVEKYKSMSISLTHNNNQSASLKEENVFLKKQAHNNTQIIQQLMKEKETLKIRIHDLEDQLIKMRNNQQVQASEIRQYTNNQNTDGELRQVIRELRFELDDVKKSNAVIHDQNYQMQKYLAEIAQNQANIPYFGNDSSVIRYQNLQNINSLHQDIVSSRFRMQMQADNFVKNRSKHFNNPYFRSEHNIEKKRQNMNQKSIVSPPVRDVKSPNANNKQKWQNLQRKISALRVQNDELKKTLLYD